LIHAVGKPTQPDLFENNPCAYIISGPPACGKTSLLVKRAADLALNGRVLILLPTPPAVGDFLKRLMDYAGRGFANMRVATLENFARETAKATPGVGQPAARAFSEELITHIARKRASRGRMSTLNKACLTEGFGPALHSFICELLEAGAKPDDLKKAPGISRRLREIAGLFGEYMKCLAKLGIYDSASLFHTAMESAKKAATTEYDDIIIDGFTRLSRLQVGLLATYAKNARAVVHFSIPNNASTSSLPPNAAHMLKLIRDNFNIIEAPAPRADFRSPARSLWEYIDGEAEPPPGPLPEIELLESPGAGAEIEALAVRSKRLIVEDGLEPSQICIILRGIDSQAGTVRKIFGAFGIPCNVGKPRNCLGSGLVRSILSLLRAMEEDLPRERICDLLRSPFFTLESFRVNKENREPIADAFETLSLRSGLTHCKRDIRHVFDMLRKRLEFQLQNKSDDDYDSSCENNIRGIKQASEPLGGLIDALAEFKSKPKGFVKWLEAFEDLLDKLGLKLPKPEDTGKNDLYDAAAWDALARGVSDTADAATEMGDDKITWAQFTRKFISLASRTNLRTTEGKMQAIRIIDPYQASPLRFKAVLIGSLVEGDFPRRETSRVFLNPGEATMLASAGIHLPERHSIEEERELFRHCLSRADETLILSHSYIDEQARPKVVSAFLNDVTERLKKIDVHPTVYHKSVSPIVPDLSQVVSYAHLRRHMVYRLQSERQKKMSKEISGIRALCNKHSSRPITRAARAIQVENRRWREGPCDEYDGVLNSPAAIDCLREKFPQTWFTSAAHISAYGQCPFCFFASDVLALQEEDTIAESLTPLERGQILHQALAAFFRKLDISERLNPGSHTETLHKLTDKIISRFKKTRANAYEILWKPEADFIHRVLDNFISARGNKSEGWLPAHFEISFGMVAKNPGSTPEYLKLEDGDLTVALRGRIDRIDEMHRDDTLFLRVVDYKTSLRPGAHTEKTALAGEDLQIPLYMIAASEVIYSGRAAVMAEGAYEGLLQEKTNTILAIKNMVPGEHTPNWKIIDDQARLLPVRYLAKIRDGYFPLTPRKDCAKSYCPFKPVCRMSEARINRKAPDERAE